MFELSVQYAKNAKTKNAPGFPRTLASPVVPQVGSTIELAFDEGGEVRSLWFDVVLVEYRYGIEETFVGATVYIADPIV
jgi:hypothetical protein